MSTPQEKSPSEAQSEEKSEKNERRKIWDGATRFFHWAMAFCFVGAIVSGELDYINWHGYFGVTLLSLIVFRLVWGVFGSQSARFTYFVKGPRAVFAHARQLLKRGRFDAEHYEHPGHNALSGWVVVTLITLLLIMGIMGLFSSDEELFRGPLSFMVTYATSLEIAHYHRLLGQVLIFLAIVHVLAVLFYWVYKKENLLMPMIVGSTREKFTKALWFVSPWRAVVLLVVIGGTLIGWYTLS